MAELILQMQDRPQDYQMPVGFIIACVVWTIAMLKMWR